MPYIFITNRTDAKQFVTPPSRRYTYRPEVGIMLVINKSFITKK
ncbi:hypothetical protein [Kamptonema sp. UHCC 0994]|nr:hypothetical protein [Kamptonema sp. UHCC 0994]MDF0553559.1 hypothetical protein [Kamptonema sp. UHCC 0994]